MNRQKRKSIRTNKGFTLLEAMMAVFVLAVAASGISMAFAAAGTVQVEAQRRILASRLAADKIEEIAAMGYGDIKNNYIPQLPLAPETAAAMGYVGDIYNGLSCTVEECEEIPVPDGNQPINLIQITVAAKYNNQEITRITTLIGDKDKH